MEVKLSERLKTIAQRIPLGSRLADIGSDHALLPVFAVQQGIALSAVAGEINEGPLLAARKQIAEAGLEQRIIARKGDGLEAVQPGEVDVVAIAGMGGSTMEAILERGNANGRLEGVHTLILQPNVGEAAVRHWLIRRNWLLTDETIVEEDGLYYEVLTAVPAREADRAARFEHLYRPIALAEGVIADQELLLLMGPYLLRAPNAVFHAKWSEEIGKRERILDQMNRSDSEVARSKRDMLLTETEKIKEVLACLRTDKPSSN